MKRRRAKSRCTLLFVTLSLIVRASAVYADNNNADGLIFVDKRSYRHCHNVPRHVICHTSDAYPPVIRRPRQDDDDWSNRKPRLLDRRQILGHMPLRSVISDTVLSLTTLISAPIEAADVSSEQTRRAAQHAVGHSGDTVPDARAWCMIHYLYREFEQSVDDCTVAIGIDTKDDEPFSNRGSAHLALKNVDLAIADFTTAIALAPTNPKPLYNRGIAFEFSGQFSLAIRDYSRAIEIDPEFSVAYLNRAQVRQQLGDVEQAVEDYQKALALNRALAPLISNKLRKLGIEP